MANTSKSSDIGTIYKIRFKDSRHRLTREWVGKQLNAETYRSKDWNSPTLKFISFQDGQLLLLNSWENQSYKLLLQVQEKDLHVSCSCGNTGSSICKHAYAGIYTILWHNGDHYFAKFRKGGAISLAFSHKDYFDKKESVAGIDVAPRPELSFVFGISRADEDRFPHIFEFTSTPVVEQAAQTDQQLCYIIAASTSHKIVPALLPCQGILNKERTGIKFFNNFLTGIDKHSEQALSTDQKKLNASSLQLWKMVEHLPGHLLRLHDYEVKAQDFEEMFNAWKEILPVLLQQPFVYCYYLYGTREFKKKPRKERLRKVVLSPLVPSIRFVLIDKGIYYQLRLQVWVNGKELKSVNTETTLFITEEHTLYLLSSLRDAAIVEWIRELGGCVTIFKENFAEFERDILLRIKDNYPVEVISSRKKV